MIERSYLWGKFQGWGAVLFAVAQFVLVPFPLSLLVGLLAAWSSEGEELLEESPIFKIGHGGPLPVANQQRYTNQEASWQH